METNFWKVILMPDQTYLGYCVVSLLRRDCGDLADLNSEEIADFFKLAKKLEDAFRQAFNATMFNWACLMNFAYQNNPPDPHVHWHFRPRYNHVVKFAGLEFVDPNFGHHYQPSTMREVDLGVREKIVEEILKFVGSSF